MLKTICGYDFFHFIFQKIFSTNLVTYLWHPFMPKILENDWFPDVFKHFHHSINMPFIASLVCMSTLQTWIFTYRFLLFFSLLCPFKVYIYSNNIQRSRAIFPPILNLLYKCSWAYMDFICKFLEFFKFPTIITLFSLLINTVVDLRNCNSFYWYVGVFFIL